LTTAQQPARQVRQWTATERQLAFLERTEYEVLTGGAKFGLKTDSLLMWTIMRRQKYAGSRGLFIRRELAELTKQGAAWDRAGEILSNSVKYNQTDHTITFPNGSVLEFGHCQHDADKLHYQGAQYDDICFDQLEQFTEELYLYIQGACRVPKDNPPTDKAGNPIQARIRASANPGDIGHTFVRRRFIDVTKPETPYRYTVTVPDPEGVPVSVDRDRVFIPSTVFDSIKAGIIGPEYIATLDAMPEPYRTAYLYGRWDIVVGLFFFDAQAVEDGTQDAKGFRPLAVFPPTMPETLRAAVDAGYLRIWTLPRPGLPYVMGTDGAEGKGLDYSNSDILEAKTLRHVASLRDNVLEPAEHGRLAAALAKWYNDAWCMVERSHGEAILVQLTVAGCRLYHHDRRKKEDGTFSEGTPGFPMTGQTRTGLLDDLGEVVKDRSFFSPDPVFWSEAGSFIVTLHGRAEAATSAHDDTVIGKALCVRMARQPGAQTMRSTAPADYDRTYGRTAEAGSGPRREPVRRRW
jgi:hypothetical protein